LATSRPTESRRGALSLGGTPILLYHGLSSYADLDCSSRARKYWVLAGHFRDQLASICAMGHHVISLGELWTWNWDPGREGLPAVVTFDDGLSSDYEVAFPLLLEAALPAEFFVSTANVGRKGFLTWQQVNEMQRAGMSFQSHSHDHVDLVRLPIRERERQLKVSKQILEARLGQKVEFIAVPYGRLSTEVTELAVEAGYRAVCTSRSWPKRPGSRLVNRVAVYAKTSPHAFKQLLAGNLSSFAIRAAQEAMLFFPKLIVSHFTQSHQNHIGLEKIR
jgi:peptidoglycan/xylan/chitin deacetylase (PgdA/CDA1 family)